MTREILRMPSQYAVYHLHVPSQPALLPPCRDPGGLQSRNNQPPDIWNSQGISGNVFANPPASSSSPYPQGFNPRISNATEDTLVTHKYGATRYMWWTSDSRHSLNSEISARTVSRKFIRPQGGKILKELWGRPTKTAALGTSLWQIPLLQQHLLVGRWDSKLRCVLVHNFLGKRNYRSKKWRWLNQWMI